MLVGQEAKQSDFWWAKDVHVTFRYPREGEAPYNITFLDVAINQTTPHKQIRILNGGVGHRFVFLTISAPQTKKYDYSILVYANGGLKMKQSIVSNVVLVVLVYTFISRCC